MGISKTFGEHISEYLQHIRERGTQDALNTVLSTESRLKSFLEFYTREAQGDYSKLDVKMAKAYVAFLFRERKLSTSAARNHLSAARTFWSWLWEERHVSSNPFMVLKGYVKPKRLHDPQPLTEQELEDFLSAEDDTAYRALWEVYAATGARQNEVRTLLHKNVDLEAGEITCTLKGGDVEPYPLDERSLKYLRAHIGTGPHDPESPVFPRRYLGTKKRRAKQPFISKQVIQNRIKQIGVRAGLDPDRMRTHLFRHTFATQLLALTQNLRVVQEALHHADIRTTQTYTHVTRKEVRDLVLLRGKRRMEMSGAAGA